MSNLSDAAKEQWRQGNLEFAARLFRAATAEQPAYHEAWANLATLHAAQHQYEASLACRNRALQLRPDSAEYWSDLGTTYWRMQRYAEARQAQRQAHELDPTLWHPLHNMGSIAYATGAPEQAIEYYRGALALRPDSDQTAWDLAWALLACGDWSAGFEQYELRWKRLIKTPAWECGAPLWAGEDLAGKTILVHHEQGYGDTLQFVRYAMHLPALFPGCRVAFAAPPALFRLLRGAEGLAEVVMINGPYPENIDYHCPVISVVRHLWPAVAISGASYLKAHPRQFAKTPDEILSVGLIWSAAITQQPGSELKSCLIEKLLPLADVPGVRLYGLQKNDGVQDLYDTGAISLITDMSSTIKDFADLAETMMGLDVIVSVDTGPLHLAGALGKSAIGLIPYERCWRWPRGNVHRTPWYQNMWVEAQPGPGDWDAAIRRVADLLDHYKAAKQ